MFNLKKIKNLVTHHLDGIVTKVDFYYISDSIYMMTIRYNGDWFYSYEYQVKINEYDKTIKHCYHICYCHLEKVNLPQEIEFEKSVLNILKRHFLENIKPINRNTEILSTTQLP